VTVTKRLESLRGQYNNASDRLLAVESGFNEKPPELEAVEQVLEAEADLWAEQGNVPRYPYVQLHVIAGGLAPGRVTIAAANSGIGKTTFALDLTDRLASSGRNLYVLGLEQRPKELRTKWACLRADVSAAIAFERTWDEVPNGSALRDAVAAEFEAQKQEPLVSRVHFSPVKTVNRARLREAATDARNIGAEILIVDHIDRLDHGEGQNSFHELRETMRLCTDLADEMALHVLLFSQLNRQASQGDRLSRYQPPQLHHLFGGSSKEQEADIVLGLFRPMSPNATKEQISAVRSGQADPQAVLAPNCTAVAVLKHRLRGEMEGKRAYLSYRHGRLSDMPECDRPIHGIKTNRDVIPYGERP